MALSLQLGYPDVPRSITNPNVDRQNAIDKGYPMSFLDFIKNINISLEPETLQTYYNFYITTWNSQSTSTDYNDRQLIIERYKDFLKEIIIKYTTLEEKTFLLKIDFNDAHDLDIALGFYSKKLKELCTFYNNKRNNIEHSILKKKLGGSSFGVQQSIKDLTLSYINTLEDSSMLYDMESITANLEIEIEELYDTYPLYFNRLPNEKIYDLKDLDYGLNIFLKNDEELIAEVFSNTSEEIKSLKEVDELFENKRKLTQKYISTDFYYLSTGSSQFEILSGKLFDHDNTIINFLNRTYPTTASTDEHQFKSEREKGFFKPSNVSFVLIDGVTKSYSIDFDSLQPNSLYFFPDPNIIGENTGVIQFTIDDSFLKRNTTSGNAVNQPASSPNDTKYYGYYSKIDPNQKKYFDCVFNTGYIYDFKQDIYGNSYGLFKSGFEKYITNLDLNDPTVYSTIFNGHEFFDTLYSEGLSFDYYVEDDTTFTETIRSGLSSHTSNFTNFDEDLKLTFGRFKPFYALKTPSDENLVKTYKYLDGALLTTNDSQPLVDPVSSDLLAFETETSPFYYTVLTEGGITNNNPQARALLDPLYPSLTAKFIPYDRSNLNVVTGGRFEDMFGYTNITTRSVYIDSNINSTEILPESSFDGFDGVLFIKNHDTLEVSPLLDMLSHISTTYNSTIVSQLSSILDCEIAYDVMSLKTQNYLIFEKIIYSDSQFLNPKQSPIYISHSLSAFNNLSNRLKVDEFIYYSTLQSEGNVYDGTLVIYPKIFRYNIKNNKNDIIYPTSTIPEMFNITDGIYYTSSSDPVLSYSERNNIFNISFLLKDQNNYPVLKSYDFKTSPNVEFIQNTHVRFTNEIISHMFNYSVPYSLSFYLSSTNITPDEGVLII